MKFIAAALTATALASPTVALHAQEVGNAATPAATSTPSEAGVGDIVVTAQRRSESLQKTPLSVTALTAEALEQRQVTSVLDVAGQVPNLTIEAVTGLGNSARVFLRGVGEDQAQFNADPAVGIYVDGVYYARTNGALFDFLDVQRLEVLRGPQGTLYGRNTPGGAINVITTRPGRDFAFAGEALYGRFNQLEGRATIRGPLADGLAASASFLMKHRDGLSTSTTLGSRVNERALWSARASLAIDPSPNFRALVTVDRTVDDSDTTIPTSNFLGAPADLFVTAGSPYPKGYFKSGGVALNASLDLGVVTIGSISAYRALHQDAVLDNDGEARLYSGFESHANQSQTSQELTASIATDVLKGIAGFYFFDENNDYDALTRLGSRTNAATNIARPDYSVQYTRSYAVFGQMTYTVVPALSVTVGGRYTWDEKSFSNSQPSVPATFIAARKWRDFSPKLGIDLQLSDTALLYASFAEGYKAGGFNRSNVRIVAETPYDPEHVRNFELGLKTDLFERRLRFNIDGFINKYDALQLSSFDPATGTTRRFNAAKATTRGIEIEASARPFTGLDLYGTLAYLDAHYDTFVDRVGGSVVDVSFRKLKGAPKWQYTVGGGYEFPVGSGTLRFNADAQYRDKVFNNVANNVEIATGARTLVNASVAWKSPGDHWTVTAAGKNLLNRQYAGNGIYIAGLLSALYPADPLTWSLSVRFKY